MAVLFFGSFSNELLNQLECHVAVTSDLLVLQSKCRELVRCDSLILATHNVSNRELYLISKVGYISSDPKVKDRLVSLGIEIMKSLPVTLSLLEVCYQFTLKARLAPKWNEISEWLTKGSDVFETGRAPAISIDIRVNRDEITLSIKVVRLILNLLKPQHLEVSSSLETRFINEPTTIIRETSITCNTCNVLPHLTQAHVYSLSHSLPSTSSNDFDSYNKIRLHWKKQYGYVLPISQSFFYQVFFKFNPSKFFSYPGCCVIRGRPLAVPCRDKDDILTSFINDIHSRMPTVCGTCVTYSKAPLLPIASLHIPTNSVHCNTRPVTMTIPTPSHVTLGYPNLPTLTCSTYQPSSHLLTKRSLPQPLMDTKRSHIDQMVPDQYETIREEVDQHMYQKERASSRSITDEEKKEIHKAKVVSLRSWLQENSVFFHSKDKKDKLVQLVTEQVKTTGKHFT